MIELKLMKEGDVIVMEDFDSVLSILQLTDLGVNPISKAYSYVKEKDDFFSDAIDC